MTEKSSAFRTWSVGFPCTIVTFCSNENVLGNTAWIIGAANVSPTGGVNVKLATVISWLSRNPATVIVH